MNIAIVQGRPTDTPELLRGNASGKVFCKFTIACDRPYRGKNVPRQTDFFDVVCFDKLAQTVYNNLAKGALCTVLGKLQEDKWENAAGDRRRRINIVAQNVTIHEWLRKNRPLSDLEQAFDDDLLVPREITDSLYKQIDIDDEDIPQDLMGSLPSKGDYL